MRAFKVRCHNMKDPYRRAVFRLVYGKSVAHAVRIANAMGWEAMSKGHEEIFNEDTAPNDG